MRPLTPIEFARSLESMSDDQRDEMAIALLRAALQCVGEWHQGRVILLNFIADELLRLEEAEARPAMLLN